MELFEIFFAGKWFYFTSYGEDIQYNGIWYRALPMSRREVDMNLQDNGLIFDAPSDLEPFKYFVLNPTIKLAKVTVRKFPEGYEIFSGSIVKNEYNYDKRTVTVTLGSKYYLSEAEVPKRTYSKKCSFDFCDENCGLNRTDYEITLNSGEFAIDGVTITSNAISGISWNLDGGYVKTDKDEYQYIITKENNSVTLLRKLVYTPNSITLGASCDKTLDMCSSYSNVDNFGGFPYIPQKNAHSEGF